MAKARKVVGDQQSEEFDELRRTVHTLLHMLESAEASLTAGATAENVLNAWADAVRTGKDDNPESIANITSTGRDVVGVQPSRVTPARRRFPELVALNKDSKSV